MIRTFDVLIASSATDFAYVSQIPNSRLMTNPVDIESFLDLSAAPLPPRGPLLYFGRLAPNKGLERLAALLRLDPARELVIVGAGDPSFVRTLTRTFAGLPVRFVGEQDPQGLLNHLRDSAAIMLPSETEGFGITLVEAMATGRPVLANDIPAYREIATGSSVVLVDFRHPAGVLQALRALEDGFDPTPSIERASSYSWPAAAPQFAGLYRELVASRARTSTS
jgi:glycosyltransferase involved in cell wall biosynthesis